MSMKLTHWDRALIHGLGVLSRPPLILNSQEHRMLVEMVGVCADRASPLPCLEQLAKAGAAVHPDARLHRGAAHRLADAMNDFDRWALGAYWDAARGVK